ncbi:MAG: hypothetical protein A2386_00995 [Elusimicrobia bacterium RIFOXYB1_FULL_48_9]|nr:MAG: hypothetical protein A2386_00995 [Elusimicrobia bacterium RIFOXYB1_FULL_48_9]
MAEKTALALVQPWLAIEGMNDLVGRTMYFIGEVNATLLINVMKLGMKPVQVTLLNDTLLNNELLTEINAANVIIGNDKVVQLTFFKPVSGKGNASPVIIALSVPGITDNLRNVEELNGEQKQLLSAGSAQVMRAIAETPVLRRQIAEAYNIDFDNAVMPDIVQISDGQAVSLAEEINSNSEFFGNTLLEVVLRDSSAEGLVRLAKEPEVLVKAADGVKEIYPWAENKIVRSIAPADDLEALKADMRIYEPAIKVRQSGQSPVASGIIFKYTIGQLRNPRIDYGIGKIDNYLAETVVSNKDYYSDTALLADILNAKGHINVGLVDLPGLEANRQDGGNAVDDNAEKSVLAAARNRSLGDTSYNEFRNDINNKKYFEGEADEYVYAQYAAEQALKKHIFNNPGLADTKFMFKIDASRMSPEKLEASVNRLFALGFAGANIDFDDISNDQVEAFTAVLNKLQSKAQDSGAILMASGKVKARGVMVAKKADPANGAAEIDMLTSAGKDIYIEMKEGKIFKKKDEAKIVEFLDAWNQSGAGFIIDNSLKQGVLDRKFRLNGDVSGFDITDVLNRIALGNISRPASRQELLAKARLQGQNLSGKAAVNYTSWEENPAKKQLHGLLEAFASAKSDANAELMKGFEGKIVSALDSAGLSSPAVSVALSGLVKQIEASKDSPEAQAVHYERLAAFARGAMEGALENIYYKELGYTEEPFVNDSDRSKFLALLFAADANPDGLAVVVSVKKNMKNVSTIDEESARKAMAYINANLTELGSAAGILNKSVDFLQGSAGAFSVVQLRSSVSQLATHEGLVSLWPQILLVMSTIAESQNSLSAAEMNARILADITPFVGRINNTGMLPSADKSGVRPVAITLVIFDVVSQRRQKEIVKKTSESINIAALNLFQAAQ